MKDRWRVQLTVAVLALGWAVLYIDRTLLFPVLPAIADELDLTDTQRGAIASAYFLPYVAMQVPAGLLGDRVGLNNVLAVMYVVIGLGLALTGLISFGYVMLVLFIAAQGLGAGAFYSGSYGITINTVPPSRRGLSSALVTAGMAAGSSLGLIISALLYSRTEDWRIGYLVMLGPTLVVAAALFLTLRTSPRVPTSMAGLRRLVGHRDFQALCVVHFFALYAPMSVITWGPSYLVDHLNVTVERAGLYIAFMSGVSLVGALTWGRLSDRFGRKRLTLGMFAAGAVVALLLPRAESAHALLLALGVFGLVTGFAWNPILVAWVGDHAVRWEKVGMGTVMGIINTAGISAAFVAPVVSGWISDTTGSLAWAFYLGAAAYVIAIAGATLVRDTAPTLPQPMSRVTPGADAR